MRHVAGNVILLLIDGLTKTPLLTTLMGKADFGVSVWKFGRLYMAPELSPPPSNMKTRACTAYAAGLPLNTSSLYVLFYFNRLMGIDKSVLRGRHWLSEKRVRGIDINGSKLEIMKTRAERSCIHTWWQSRKYRNTEPKSYAILTKCYGTIIEPPQFRCDTSIILPEKMYERTIKYAVLSASTQELKSTKKIQDPTMAANCAERWHKQTAKEKEHPR